VNRPLVPFLTRRSGQTDAAAARLALLLVAGGQRTRRLISGTLPEPGSDDPRGGLADALIREVKEAMRTTVPDVLDRITAAGWRWLTPEHGEYPSTLAHTADPPLGLFVRGRLTDGPTVAVVGARRATAYGIQAARGLAEVVAGAGGTVISGMARGIDTAAHAGALAANGTTWAVWAAGPDRIYPAENRRLAESIAHAGALITEYPPGTPPRRHHFLERNRIIAGLSKVVVVVEAAARSGALNTARHAIDDNRDVMAVPGSIFSELSVGPNGLIRAGAAPVTTPSDVLEVLGLVAEHRAPQDGPLADVLGPAESLSIDELAQRLAEPVAAVMAQVLEMELCGRLERAADGTYRRPKAPFANATGQQP